MDNGVMRRLAESAQQLNEARQKKRRAPNLDTPESRKWYTEFQKEILKIAKPDSVDELRKAFETGKANVDWEYVEAIRTDDFSSPYIFGPGPVHKTWKQPVSPKQAAKHIKDLYLW